MTITTIILAGGKSRRMGQDKAFILWDNKMFIQHIIDAAKPLSDKILLSGNDKRLNGFGYEVVNDLEFDKGPVVAIHSCLQRVEDGLFLVVSCDVPQITADDLKELVNNHNNNFDQTMYIYQNKKMPLVAVYENRCKQAFQNAFLKKIQRLFDVVDTLNTQIIEFKGKQGLTNINTKEDLAVL